jgi:PAS domain S-box-containing protein
MNLDTKYNILVVDDNSDHVRIIKNALSDTQLHVDSTETLQGTVDFLEAFEYDLIFIDIMLPEINGFDLIEKVRALNKTVSIIIMSAFGSEEDAVQAIKKGANDYLAKNVGFEHRVKDMAMRTIQQARMTEELRMANLKYEQVFNTANDIFLTLDLNLNIVDFNERFLSFFKSDSNDHFRGKSFLSLIPSEAQKKIFEAYNSVVYEGMEPVLYSVTLLNSEGQKKKFEVNTSVIKEAERITGALCVARDITENSSLLEKQNAMQYRLMEKHQLALIGNMVSGIAHNINTPLATIMGHADLLQIKNPKSKEAQIIIDQCARISDIIRNMVYKVQNEQSSHSEPWDINHIITEELNFFNSDNQFRHQIIKTVELNPKVPKIPLVYQNFTQAFDAFIQNAIEAMEDSAVKELTIRTDYVDENIHLDIEDTGVGIPKEKREKLFKPFYTTKEEQNSDANLGLGLYNAYLLMQPYGVTFDVESNEEKTRFRWIIPTESA